MSKQRYTIVAHCFDKRGILISCATNNYEKSHPLQKYFAEKVGHVHRIYLHAEIAAMLRAKDRQIHSIHIFRYGANGETLLAKPCPICMEAIKAFNIKQIFWSTPTGMKSCSQEELSTINQK